MYLKSIEMQGFKSFADKILLEFNEGVTGIVGPNGSGKSNIADAVRWVLGEQSAKQLRGMNLQDVIFSGTENRKAVSYAYVTLRMDNSDRSLPVDYDTVIVTRKIYRSGESEYYLGGSICRLKDIVELFYDTGVGREGYSIIGQGQIDQILSGKPEDRRELFDEAAGIVKYKKRHSEALKKLEDEHQSLVRVNDILSELENQVGPLEDQAKKAHQYLRFRDECRQYEVQIFSEEQTRREGLRKELSDRLEILSGDILENQKKTADCKEKQDALFEKNNALSLSLQDLRAKNNALQIQIENRKGRILLLQEQISHHETSAGRCRDRMGEIAAREEENRSEAEKAEQEISVIKEDLETLRTEQDLLAGRLQEKEEEIRVLSQEISESQEEVIRQLNSRSVLESRRQRCLAAMEQISLQKETVKKQMEDSGDADLGRQKKREQVLLELSQTEEGLEALKKEQQELLRKESEEAAAREEIRGRLSEASHQYERSHSRYESLKNIAERYEGFGGSTRQIMDNRALFPGVRGTVSDLIRTEKKYETAIETALGSAVQNIVTDDESTAKACVAFLKENRYGRSTFLPLESIQKKDFARREVLREAGVIGLASTLIQAPADMPALASYLLGNVIVIENLDRALEIARKYHYDFRIVTLEGDQLNRGGSITGGAFKNASNLLGRRRELAELRKSSENSRKEQEELQKQEAEATTRLVSIRSRKDQIREQLMQAEIRRKSAEGASRALEEQERSGRKAREERKAELSALESRITELQGQAGILDQELAETAQLMSRGEGSSEEKKKQLEKLRRERDEMQLSSGRLSADLAAAAQKKNFMTENISRIKDAQARLAEEKAENSRNERADREAICQVQAEIEQIQEELALAGKDSSAAEKAMQEAEEENLACQARQRQAVEERESLAVESAALEKEKDRLEHQQEKAEEAEAAAAAYLWSEYEITPSEALTQAALVPEENRLSSSERKKKTQEIKTSMKKLGPVNLGSIEEYREVSVRYQFLKNQHDDLVRAEESLTHVITDLEQNMRRQFSEKFALIQKEFDKVFRELFGGGKASLELDAPDNILESGIQIIAQPPGKKLISIMQMSGGEKALTAISILFAIQNLKPSPFCILDEIEAALDDVNVSRFAEYLKKLSDNTQFITITHRRGTMLAADRLYGITMQEKGISLLVSVNLSDS